MLVLCLGLLNSDNGTQWFDEGKDGKGGGGEGWELRRVILLVIAEIFLDATGELGSDGG